MAGISLPLRDGLLTLPVMPERPIEDELRELAEQIVAGPDIVAEFGEKYARMYREERAVIKGMLEVDAMVRGDQREVDEHDPRLVAIRERLRDRLKALLVWAKKTGRV